MKWNSTDTTSHFNTIASPPPYPRALRIVLIRKIITVALFPAVMATSSSALSQEEESQSTIDQTGTMNSAIIEQQNESAGMSGYINQGGTLNDAYLLQVGPVEETMAAEIWQTGSSNTATAEQSAVEQSSELVITQDGNNNQVDAKQTGVVVITGSVHQSGELNNVSLYQAQPRADATVEQFGTANDAIVEQTAYETYSHGAAVYQEGQSNRIQVLQDGIGGSHLDSRQIGANNYTDVHQTEGGDFVVGVTYALMETNGNNNEIYVEQHANGDGDFTLTQSGDGNFISIFQTGEGMDTVLRSEASNNNSDTIDQRGTGGLVEISRYFSDDSRIEITQWAYGEKLFVEQGHSLRAETEINQLSTMGSDILVRQVHSQDVLASITQRGPFGDATIEQIDGVQSSTAIIEQNDGIDLIASIYQADGTDISLAEIQQENEDNVALIEQRGVVDNSALIVQSGSGSYAEIIQTGAEGGLSNSASIHQSGEGFVASIYQDGVNNEATIVQP